MVLFYVMPISGLPIDYEGKQLAAPSWNLPPMDNLWGRVNKDEGIVGHHTFTRFRAYDDVCGVPAKTTGVKVLGTLALTGKAVGALNNKPPVYNLYGAKTSSAVLLDNIIEYSRVRRFRTGTPNILKVRDSRRSGTWSEWPAVVVVRGGRTIRPV